MTILGRDWLSRRRGFSPSSLRAPSAETRRVLASQGVDALLTTALVEYEEVEGSSVGGEPATVSFVMGVVSLPDGKEVWRGTYFFRQEPLTNNWLRLGERVSRDGSGVGWRSARAELERGLAGALSDFGNRRTEQFLSQSGRRK